MVYKITYFDSSMLVRLRCECDTWDDATYEARCYTTEGLDPEGPIYIPVRAIHMTCPNGYNYRFNFYETRIKDVWVQLRE